MQYLSFYHEHIDSTSIGKKYDIRLKYEWLQINIL